MNVLKILTYIILLSVVLFTRPGMVFCLYNGAIEIVDDVNDNGHCAEIGHSKSESHQNNNQKFQQNHECCVDIVIVENQRKLASNNFSFELKIARLPIIVQNYLMELQKQFSANENESQAKSRPIYPSLEYELFAKKSTNFQFTSTVLLLI